MKSIITAHVWASRFMGLFHITPILIALSLFLGTIEYKMMCLGWLLLNGLYSVINSYRDVQHEAFFANPMRSTFTAGSIVETGKKFHQLTSVGCLVLGLAKGGIAGFQILHFTHDELCRLIYVMALSHSVSIVLTELLLNIIIVNAWESKYLSMANGIKLKSEILLQNEPSCLMARHVFTVVDNPYISNTYPL